MQSNGFTGISTIESVTARIERLPESRWHRKIRIIIGAVTFFDAFDAVSIAFVLPVLSPLWHLSYGETGLLISAGFFGQMLGAVLFGYLA